MGNVSLDGLTDEQIDQWIEELFRIYWGEQKDDIRDAFNYMVRSRPSSDEPVELSLEWN